MKKLVSLLLVCAILLSILSGCSIKRVSIHKTKDTATATETTEGSNTDVVSEDVSDDYFQLDLDDYASDTTLRYVEDMVYTSLVAELDSEEYFVENVQAVYISQEYINDLMSNSQSNIYFGYTLDAVKEVFQDQKFVFTLGEDGETTVKAFEKYDDTYEQIIKNVAIGSGVILVCVVISVATEGAGAPAAAAIFAASAKAGAIGALTGTLISGTTAGVMTGIQTDGDMSQALKAAALSGSEGFKWGAVTGAITGGASKAIALKGATLNGLTMNQAAAIQKESGYPLDVIKQFKSVEEYNVYKDAGLTTQIVDGKIALVRDIDLNYIDEESGLTNLQRMKKGYSPIDAATGETIELHHVNQEVDGTLATLTQSEHRGPGQAGILNTIGKEGVHSEANLSDAEWNLIKAHFWKDYASNFSGN